MILASQSPRRRAILEGLGMPVEVRPADIDEARLPDEGACDLVRRLAAEKAAHVAASAPARPDVVVAADTVVWTEGGSVLGKPRDAAEARAMLASLSGRTHHVSTGVCLLALGDDGRERARRTFVETTDVEFWPLDEALVSAYVASGEPMDKAGSYGIQGRGSLLVRSVRGDYANVVGLPASRLVRELADLLGDDALVATVAGGGLDA